VEVPGGFVDAEGRASGRPVSVVLDRTGALRIVDDAGYGAWHVSAVH
jgi:hypothetical protein